jgi:hypothetical protein
VTEWLPYRLSFMLPHFYHSWKWVATKVLH